MNSMGLAMIKATMAVDICRNFQLSEPAQSLLEDDRESSEFLSDLIDKNYYIDATHFLAHGLEKRAAVYWAHLCVTSTMGNNISNEGSTALEAAKRWIRHPDGENASWDAYQAAEATESESPATCVAMAAFVSGRSLAPPGMEAVPPSENLTGVAVSTAIVLAAVYEGPEKADEKYQRFTEQGMDIARGGKGNLDQLKGERS